MVYWLISLLSALSDLHLKNRIEARREEFFPYWLPGRICLQRHHNYGFSMNRAEKHPRLVHAVSVAVFGLFLGFFADERRQPASTAGRVGLALALGGGFSNLHDRLFRGYVVDYFRLACRRVDHIILNLGDVFLFLGTGLVLLASLFSREKTPEN